MEFILRNFSEDCCINMKPKHDEDHLLLSEDFK